MQIVLHAGMHKTGTTSFQNWLRANKAKFRAKGIATFPLDTRALANAPNLFNPEGLRHDLAVAEKSGARTAVFSHESLCQLYPRGFARLLEAFDGRPVRLVVTLRHWSTFWPSRWMQNAKRRDAHSFSAYQADLLAKPDGKIDAQIWLPLQRAKEAGFKDLRVVPYNPSPNALIWTLARACDCPAPKYEETSIANRSADATTADRNRMFNGIAAQMHGEPLNPMAGEQSCTFFDLTKASTSFTEAAPSESAELDQFLHDTTDLLLTSLPIFDVWRTELISHVKELSIPADWSTFTAHNRDYLFASASEFTSLPLSTAQAMREHLKKCGLPLS